MTLYWAATFFFGICIVFIAMEDAFNFEILLEALPILAVLSIYLGFYFGMSFLDMLYGAALFGLPALLLWVVAPTKIGQGDIWMLATSGLFFGIENALIPALVLGAALLATSLFYAFLRQKRAFGSIAPMAPAVMAALFVELARRIIMQGFDPDVGFGWALTEFNALILSVLGGIVVWRLQHMAEVETNMQSMEEDDECSMRDLKNINENKHQDGERDV